MMIGFFDERNLPGTAGSRTIFLSKKQQRQMLGNDVWNAILLTDLHRRIACPFGTVGMNDVGFPIFADIRMKHRLDNANPTLYIVPDHTRQTTLIGLINRDTITLMLITIEGKDKKVLPSNGNS